MKTTLHDSNTQPVENKKRLRELEALAGDVFTSPEGAEAWLRKPHPMLDGQTPLDVATSHEGFQRVKDLLVNIKFGGVV